MANIPNPTVNVGGSIPDGPTIEPAMVQMRGVQSRPVAAPQEGLGLLDNAFKTFFGGAQEAAATAQSADLEQQNAGQAATLDATKIAGQKQDDAYQKQAEADAENGNATDPVANQFRSYANAYAATKGHNAGVMAAENFAHTVLPTLGPNSNFDQAVTDYVKNNHFDTGNPFYDGPAAIAFRNAVLGMRSGFQGDVVKATIQDGAQQLNAKLGSKVADGTITTDDVQQGLSTYKTLNPMDAVNAGPTVMRSLFGAAKTVPQMTRVLSLLNEPGSFAPGVSYAHQFPDRYAEPNEQFARQGQEVTSLDAAQTFDSLQTRIDAMRESGDLGAMPQLQADLNKASTQYGAPLRVHAMERQLIPMLRAGAVQTATFNTLDQGVSNPAMRDPKLFDQKGDAYFKARGIDPLNSAPTGANTLSGTEAAARTVAAYGSIPSDTKLRVSGALNNGAAPDQQEAAYNFYHQVAATVGEANVLQLMTPEAQQTYQMARDLSAGGANVRGVLSSIVTAGKSDLKDVPDTTIANNTDPAAAKLAINGAITTAINNAWNTNGYRVLDPVTGATPATISPEVQQRIASQIKTGAIAASNMGPLDLPTLAKQAVEREMPNMATLPGNNGNPVVVYVPGMPSQVPDPNNPGQTRPVVPAGRAVMNPVTKQPEDTTATATGDLWELTQHMPGRYAFYPEAQVAGALGRGADTRFFGARGGLSLSAALGSYAGDLTRSTGVFTVMEGGMGGSPGQPVVLDGKTPITLTVPGAAPFSGVKGSQMIPGMDLQTPMPEMTPPDAPQTQQVTLGDDPQAAAAQIEKLWPGNPFVLLPMQTPQGTAYGLGYRFRLTGTLPTADDREKDYRAPPVLVMPHATPTNWGVVTPVPAPASTPAAVSTTQPATQPGRPNGNGPITPPPAGRKDY